MHGGDVPLINEAAVEGLGLGFADHAQAVEAAFVAASRGEIVWKPKATISQPDGAWLIGSLGCWPGEGLSLFHNIAGTAPRAGAHYHSLQLLADYETAKPLALVDGSTASNWLPACVTFLAARHLARSDSRTVAFIGAGLQARVNLAALSALLPLDKLLVASRTTRSAEEFAAHAREKHGVQAEVVDPKLAVESADVIVSSVPSGSGAPFLDPAWVRPGAFVSAVDLGRSWLPGFAAFDRIVCDDRAQAIMQLRDGRLPHDLAYDSEIGDLLTGARPGRENARQRIVAVHPGNLVGVLGLTRQIYRRWESRAAGIPAQSAQEG